MSPNAALIIRTIFTVGDAIARTSGELGPSYQAQAGALAMSLTPEDLDEAIAAVQAKHDEIRSGKSLRDMSSEALATALGLSDLAQILRAEGVYLALKSDPILWTAKNIVPVLTELAPVVLPVLLAL